MLDSSPVALPPIPRPLKRSASTASLPTPPRSYRKSARGKSRGSCDSDSDESVALRSDDEPLGQRHKKRRIGGEKQVDEDAFWLGTPAPTNLTPKTKDQPSKSIASTTTVGSTTSPPVTPKTRSSTRRALRDSPDNPFLDTPKNHDDDTSSNNDSSANSSPHEPLQERPTIAYVLYVFPPPSSLLIYLSVLIIFFFFFSRGVRREIKNPLYNHAQDRPCSPPPESKLSIDHPDYSPSIHCIPKRLFSDTLSKRKKQKKASTAASKKQDPQQLSRKRTRQRSPSLSDDDEDCVGEIRPLKLNFGSGKKRATGGSSLDQEIF